MITIIESLAKAASANLPDMAGGDDNAKRRGGAQKIWHKMHQRHATLANRRFVLCAASAGKAAQHDC